MSFQKSFGQWLKVHRRAMDLTQETLAEQVGCSAIAIRKIESEVRRPSHQIAERLAHVFGIPPHDQHGFIAYARQLNPSYAAYTYGSDPKRPSKPNNLQSPPTGFVGRSTELRKVARFLRRTDCRLLSIVGAGGSGKTSLAFKYAHQALQERQDLFPHGVYFVNLVSLSSEAEIITAIAEALKLLTKHRSNPETELLNHLSNKNLLIVLDNFEHVLEASAVLDRILRQTTGIKLLVTSRERLKLADEWLLEIYGLPYPRRDSDTEKYDAVELFLQRAKRIRADFQLTEQDKPYISQICELVGGMPLGIELAVSWVNVLSCKEIAKAIQDSVDILTTNMRDVPERHRSMRAVFDYTWQRLSFAEQNVLKKLSVFRSSFTLDAAQAIANATPNLLNGLCDKFLVTEARRQGRYEIHELLRQYLHEGAADLIQRLERTYVDYYANFVYEHDADLKGRSQKKAAEEIAQEIENIRVMWQIASLRRDYAIFRKIADTFYWACDFQSALDVHDIFLVPATHLAPMTGEEPHPTWAYVNSFRLRALLLDHSGSVQFVQKEIAQCLDIVSRYNDPFEIAMCLIVSGVAEHFARGSFERCMAYLQPALHYVQELNNAYYTADIVDWIGMCHNQPHQFEQAIGYFKRSVQLKLAIKEHFGLGWTYQGLGFAYIDVGRYQEAEYYLRKAYVLLRELNSLSGILWNNYGLARIAIFTGQFERAEALAREIIDVVAPYGYKKGREFGLSVLGFIEVFKYQHYERGQQLCEESRSFSDSIVSSDLNYWILATVAYCQEDITTGNQYYETVRQLDKAGVRGPMSINLAIGALQSKKSGDSIEAVKRLSRASANFDDQFDWLERWSIFVELRRQLQAELTSQVFEDLWDEARLSHQT
jgi:predicted ATPase/transcriptional regulator with XRE-family HTH domain